MTRLGDVQRNWEGFARSDPLWAICTRPDDPSGKWTDERFFATGEEEISEVLDHLERLGYPVDGHGTALDFGCGVGRLTQALARRFERAVGVDIAPTMIQLAREYNRSPETCEYLVNDRPDLSLFPSGHFSFVYSALVLQHMPPRYALKYVREFLRALEPGGRLVFRIPLELLYIEEAPATSASTLAGLKERLRPRTRARHFVRRMQRRVAGSGEDEPYVMGMWSISESEIRRTVQSGKGKVVGVRRLDCPFDEVTPENRSAGTMRGYVDGEYSVVKLD